MHISTFVAPARIFMSIVYHVTKLQPYTLLLLVKPNTAQFS